MNALFKKVMIAAVVFPLTFSSVYAKQGGQGGNSYAMPLKAMLQQVDLTAEQQLEIKTIMQSYRTQQQANKGTFHDSQMAILKAEQFDAEQAGALIDAKDALRKDKKLKRMQMMFEVYHSLTPEQQAKMDLLFAQQQEKMLNQAQGKGQKKNK